jgi:CubicO group peptidase (beta-lactamase class C family)
MLAHASGLQREPVGRIWENLEAPDQERLLRELEDAEQVLPVHFAFHYSNLAFALLGQIVELSEARPWGDVVAQRILRPLEMKNTGLAPDETTAGPGRMGWATTCRGSASGSSPVMGARCPGSLPGCGSGARTGSGPRRQGREDVLRHLRPHPNAHGFRRPARLSGLPSAQDRPADCSTDRLADWLTERFG